MRIGELSRRTGTSRRLLRYYEEARSLEGGYSVSAYIEQFARDNPAHPDVPGALALVDPHLLQARPDVVGFEKRIIRQNLLPRRAMRE